MIKLAEGTYSINDLNGRGFVGAQSLMIPFGYFAILTSEAMGMIVQNIYYSTTSTIPVTQITSVQIVKS